MAVRIRPFKKNELDMNAKLCVKMVIIIPDSDRTVQQLKCLMIKENLKTLLSTTVFGHSMAIARVTMATSNQMTQSIMTRNTSSIRYIAIFKMKIAGKSSFE